MPSLKASEIGKQRIEQARVDKGWLVDDPRWLIAASKVLDPDRDWYEGEYAYGCSEPTLKRFRQGKSIKSDAFKAFCEALGLQWKDIRGSEASFSSEQSNQFAIQGIPNNVPRSNVVEFVGRSQELVRLHERLQIGNRVAIAAIAGMGGLGKTELAIQYSNEYEESYPGGLCWLKAEDSDLGSQIIDFAQLSLKLQIPQQLAGKKLSVDKQVDWCWQHWQPAGLVLIILDNLEALDVCHHLIPRDKRFRVLVTTRQHKLDPSFYEISLDVLHIEESLQLFTSLLGTDSKRVDREIETAKDLCKWLGNLPLGIELVGRYMAEDPDLLIEEMLERLKVESIKDESLDLSEQKKRRLYPLMTAQRGVRAAFELSWKKLDATAANFGRLLSLFASTSIPWDLIEVASQEIGWNTKEAMKSKRELLKFHLIQYISNDLYKVHPLIQEFFEEKFLEDLEEISRNDFRKAFTKSVLEIANKHFRPEMVANKKDKNLFLYIPHLKKVADNSKNNLEESSFFILGTSLGEYFLEKADYKEAEYWFNKTLSIVSTRFDSNDPGIIVSLNNLANCFSVQGRYKEAEKSYLRILKFLESTSKISKPIIASCFNNLASLYERQGRFDEAEALNKKAMDMVKECYGDEQPEMAVSLNNIANLYESQGRYDEAETIYKQALHIRKKIFGEEHPAVAQSLNNLGVLYCSQERFLEAQPIHKKALEIKKKLYGDEHPEVAQSLHNLGYLYFCLGSYKRARTYYLEALRLREKLLGNHHTDLANTKEALGSLYAFEELYSEAEELIKQALYIREQALGSQSSYTAQTLACLGVVYARQNRYKDAEKSLSKALKIFETTVGLEHKLTVVCAQQLKAIRAILVSLRRDKALYKPNSSTSSNKNKNFLSEYKRIMESN